ncbi:MAG: carbon-nitrogen hydrolase family protein [Corynebacterium sp.]|nr:carbon-nitrogen hydrolase family protein [Corynebacterium sp.]
MVLPVSTAAAHFGRDTGRALRKIEGMIRHAHTSGAGLLVLPSAAIGGYIGDLRDPSGPDADLPPAVDLDGPEIAAVTAAAGDLVVCLGVTERGPDGARYNTAVCLDSGGILGTHRKVHLPLNESRVYTAGTDFRPFETPVGRIGLMTDFDKTFPEAARTLALDGAKLIACLSAWPASVTRRADRLANDRQAHLFDLYDCARAAENQVYVVSSNQTGAFEGLRFLGQAKIVDPAGEILGKTWSKSGVVTLGIDIDAGVYTARRQMNHLRQRSTRAYRLAPEGG